MSIPEAASTPPAPAPCANCGHVLTGPFCAACGQEARDVHRPFGALAREAIGDVFNLDTRLIRTIGPLLLKPGEVTRRFRRGHRVTYVPPLKTYLVAALVFFGLFALSPWRNPEREFLVADRAELEAGSATTVDLPERLPFFNDAYQRAAAKARANPSAFFDAFFASIPKLFFLLLPLFALYLELFYRKEGYYIDHLVFSLYYHAFVFAMLSIMLLGAQTAAWAPRWPRVALGYVGWLWIVVHLPLALHTAYGGARWKTALKFLGLFVLYLFSALLIAGPLLPGLALFSL